MFGKVKRRVLRKRVEDVVFKNILCIKVGIVCILKRFIGFLI